MSHHSHMVPSSRRHEAQPAAAAAASLDPDLTHPRKLMPEWLLRLISQVRLVE